MDEVEHVHLADDLLGVVAEHPTEGRTGVPQGAVGVYYRDVFRGVLHDRAQPPVVLSRWPVEMLGLTTATRATVAGVVSVCIRGVQVFLSGNETTAVRKYT